MIAWLLLTYGIFGPSNHIHYIGFYHAVVQSKRNLFNRHNFYWSNNIASVCDALFRSRIKQYTCSHWSSGPHCVILACWSILFCAITPSICALLYMCCWHECMVGRTSCFIKANDVCSNLLSAHSTVTPIMFWKVFYCSCRSNTHFSGLVKTALSRNKSTRV